MPDFNAMALGCYEIFARLGVGGTIGLSELKEQLRLKGISCSGSELKIFLNSWTLEGRIKDNGGVWNEYSFFENLNIRRVECLPSNPVVKIVDNDPENLDFPNGRVGE